MCRSQQAMTTPGGKRNALCTRTRMHIIHFGRCGPLGACRQPDSLLMPEGSAPVLNALCTPMTGGDACEAPVLYGDIGGEPRPRGPAMYMETTSAPWPIVRSYV